MYVLCSRLSINKGFYFLVFDFVSTWYPNTIHYFFWFETNLIACDFFMLSPPRLLFSGIFHAVYSVFVKKHYQLLY